MHHIYGQMGTFIHLFQVFSFLIFYLCNYWRRVHVTLFLTNYNVYNRINDMGRVPFSKLANSIHKNCKNATVKNKKRQQHRNAADSRSNNLQTSCWGLVGGPPLPPPTSVATPLIRANIRAIEYMRMFVLQQLSGVNMTWNIRRNLVTFIICYLTSKIDNIIKNH